MNPYTSYRSSQVKNAPAEDLTPQLLEGARIRIRGARDKWRQGQYARASELRSQARKIIDYLDETLDFKAGGNIAYDLDALYNFMSREINQSVRDKDFERLAGVEEILDTLHRGFVDAALEYRRGKREIQRVEVA